jgi:phosphoenolpyruvate-protein kinase (PTS system EI component)
MAIDVGALRKFQEVWAPVVACVPAVLDMAAKQADFERGLAQAAIDLEKAKAEVQGVYDAADARLVQVNAELLAQQQAAAQVKADAVEAKKKASAAQKAAEAKLAETLATADAALTAKKAELADVDRALALAKQQAAADHEAYLSDLAAKAADAEKRLAAAERALESLKSKLG